MTVEPVDVCVIDDDAVQRALLFRRLSACSFSVVEAEDGETGLATIRRYRPRVVICDLLLPGMSAIDVCRHIRTDAALDGAYVVVITACRDRESKNRALNSGADDFLTKPVDPDEFLARVRNGLRISRLQERLRQAALTDGLTQLWNHAQFRALLDREFARTRRYGGTAALLMIDLDYFKAVNDAYGHEVGNEVLQGVARQLRMLVRDTDIVARYGGEEFAIVCPETSIEDAARLAERIRVSLQHEVRVPSCPRLTVTASIGVASTSDTQVHSVADLVNQADQALYCGKRGGRNRVIRADAVPQTVDAAPVLETDEVERLRKQVVSLSLQAKELCLQSVWALVQALEARDRFTAWHSRNTRFYVSCLAKAANLPDTLRSAISNAAMLHDLGKIGVPDRILLSTRPLTQAESAVLRQVPLATAKILEPLKVFETEALIIRHLRERWDGTGYPFGLAGNTIPIGARLLAIAEAVDALTSERPYRVGQTLDQALEVLHSCAGHQFDPEGIALLDRVLESQRTRWEKRIQRAQDGLLAMERQGASKPA